MAWHAGGCKIASDGAAVPCLDVKRSEATSVLS